MTAPSPPPSLLNVLLTLSSLPSLTSALLPSRLPFSWDTLPVFFHSANGTGPWNAAAAREISRYSLATHEKNHMQGTNPGMTQEANGPAACRQIKSVRNSSVANLYYLNSVIDWPMYKLHALLERNPHMRLKDADGDDIRIWGDPNPEFHRDGDDAGPWAFNLSVPALREAWIADCLAATEGGCDGCYVDKSDNMTQINVKMRMAPDDAVRFEVAHMEALSELNGRLAERGMFAISNNQGLEAEGTTAMMFEDFAASEHCINQMRTAARRGLVVQAHAGDTVDDGTNATVNGCGRGDTNSMAAFLIGAGDYAYYHCAKGWTSDGTWPHHRDKWLSWRAEYDRPLGRPLSNGTRGEDGVWRRNFARGTYVEFDAVGGNGTIWWGDGTVQKGKPSGDAPKRDGCRWQSMADSSISSSRLRRPRMDSAAG